MKPKFCSHLLSKLSLISIVCTAPLHAAALYKVNNADNLNLTSSWSTTSALQLSPPASLTATDAWYFNEVTMLGSKAVALGGNITTGGMALDYVTANNDNNLVISSGNTLTLNGTSLGGSGQAGTNYTSTGILLNRGTGGTMTVNADVALGATQNWVNGRSTGGFTVNGAVNLGGFALTTNIAAGTSTITGVMSGTGSALTKIGNGVLAVSGNNTFTGGVTLGAGAAATSNILEAGHNNALGTGTFNARGGILRAGTAGLNLPNAMTVAAGGFRVGGTNAFTLSGTLTIDAASRTLANYSSNGSVVSLGGITTVSGSVVAFDNAANGATGAPLLVSGAITGPGAVALSNNQNTTLAGTNTYTGTTTLSGGRLTLSGSTAAASAVTISGGALAGTGTINGSLALSGGSIALAGGATTNGPTFASGVTITNTPTVTFDNPPLTATTYDVFTYGNGTVTGIANLKVAYRGTLADDTANKKITFVLDPSQTRTWNTTTGTWDATGTNAAWLEGDQKFYTGDSAVFNEPAAASTVTISGTVNATGFTVNNSGNAYTFQTGSLTGATGFTKTGAGAVTLNNAHTFTGNVSITGGTVTGSGGVPSGNTNSSFGLKSSSRQVSVEGNATTLWLTATGGSSNTFGGGGMTASQIPTLTIKDGAAVRTGKFNTVGNIILQNGGHLTGSSTETSGSYGGYQFIGSVTSSGTGTGTFIDLNGSTRPNHLKGGASTTFDVSDLTGDSAADLSVSAPLADGSGDYAGAGSLAKSGPGTMLLSAANTYTGGTSVNGGVLEISGNIGSGALSISSGATLKTSGSGTLNGGTLATGVSNNGTLSISGTANQTLSGVIAGSGALVKSGTGVLTLSGANTFSGSTSINGGVLVVDGSGSLDAASSVTVGSAGTLRGAGVVNGAVAVAAGGTLTGGNGSTGTLSLGSLSFDSTATVNIGALENYTSFAAVESLGALALNGGAGSVTLNLPAAPIAAGTYHLISFGTTSASASQFVLGTAPALGSRQSGAIVVDGGSGSVNYEVTGINPTWTGAVSGEWSTATLASPKNWFTNVETDYIDGDAVTFDDSVGSGATAIVLNSTVTPSSVTFNNSAVNYSVSGTGGIAGATASLTKSGSGIATINTANTYGGTTTINGGTLALGSGATIGGGNIALNGGKLSLTGHALNNNISTTAGSIGGTTATINGVISGTGGSLGIDAAGIITLNGVNTYTGATNIISGGLEIGGAGQLGGGSYAGAVSNNGAVLRINTSANQTLSGAISGTGALVKLNTGTLTLSAQNTFTGNTTVDAGVVNLAGGGGAAGTIRGSVTVSNNGSSLRLDTGDATGYNGGASALTTINLTDEGNLHNNMDARIAGGNQTLGNAVINMTGASITGVAGSNLDFFLGGSAVNTFASSTTSTISGTALDLRQSQGVTFNVEAGTTPSGVDLEVSSMLTNKAPTATGPGTGTSYGNNPLIKTGAGVMKLTGASNHTGNTTINGGTLDLTSGQLYTGAYQSSAVVTVNTGATLRINNIAYNETVGSAASLGGLRDYANARVINGGTFEVTGGTHSAGNDFSVGTNGGTFRYNPAVTTSTLTLSGNANSNIPIAGALTLDAVGNVAISEIIEGAGSLTKTGAGTLSLSAANTYTGNTTVNAGTLAVSGSSLLDSASLVVNGGKVDLTGAETVTSLFFGATQQYTGTWGATGSGAQHIDDSRFSGSGVLNVTSGPSPAGYATWAATNAPGQTANQDYDNDGVSNGVEFVLGGLATTNDASKLPTLATSGGNLVFTFIRAQSSKTADVSVKIDVGTTLAAWPSSFTVGNTTAASSPGVTVTDNGNGTDTVTLTVTQAPDAKKFARLVVTIN